ncbi:class I SAM-dependent methyltransferase [Azospirillum sp. sgz301742]
MNALIPPPVDEVSLPIPPEDLHCVGDGDFLAIGREFLGHLITFAGLTPTDTVLDVGCGVGRIAVPLTQYLAPEGQYVGFDVGAAGVAWCREHVTPLHPRFTFLHLDLFHPLYNPSGTLISTQLPWPVPDGSIDVVFLTSVFTHLRADETRHYLREMTRVLKPSGRCLGTWFLLDEPRMPEGADYRLSFAEGADGAFYDTLTGVPTAAVAYRTDWLLTELEHAGLEAMILPGHWRTAENAVSYQDMTILRRPGLP